MSEPTGNKIPTVGDILNAQPSTTADKIIGNVAAAVPPIPNNATSPMDVDAKDSVAKDVSEPMKIIPQVNNANLAVENKEEAKAAPVASALPTHMSPPRDQDVVVAPLVAAAPPTAAAMNGNITIANTSSNGVAAPIITQHMPNINPNSDAIPTGASNTSRNSPMNILAAIASVESPTGEELQNHKNDDVQMKNAGLTVPFEALVHNDIILSLQDSTYKTIMYQYYRKLEEKTKDGIRNEEEEMKTKEEVYKLLKNAGGRLLNYVDYRRPNSGFFQVDEETARASEYIIV